MKQYYEIKAKHPDAILLFRVGDFYETFGEDAIKASGILGITLTRRANGAASYVELAGFPYHVGREDGLCQPMTLCFRIGNIDQEKFDQDERKRAQELYKQYQAEGKITNPRENILQIFRRLYSIFPLNVV